MLVVIMGTCGMRDVTPDSILTAGAESAHAKAKALPQLSAIPSRSGRGIWD